MLSFLKGKKKWLVALLAAGLALLGLCGSPDQCAALAFELLGSASPQEESARQYLAAPVQQLSGW